MHTPLGKGLLHILQAILKVFPALGQDILCILKVLLNVLSQSAAQFRRIDDPLSQVFAQFIGESLDAAGQFIQLSELPVHAGDGTHGGSQIDQHPGRKQSQQDQAQGVRNQVNQPENGGMDDLHHKQTG